MLAISAIIRRKPEITYALSPSASLREAAQLMDSRGIGSILILDQGRPIAVVAERDIVCHFARVGGCAHDTTLAAILRPEVHTISPEESVDAALARMTALHVRHLVVMKDAVLAGIISIGDLVAATIADREATIEHLDQYLNGRPV